MPNFYANINSNGKVVGVSELSAEVVSERLVPISKEQYENPNIFHTSYVKDAFVGYLSQLKSDKEKIVANGTDIATITAFIYDWLDVLQTDYKQDVIFEVNGIQQAVQPVKGVATVTLSSEEPGEFFVTTVNLDHNRSVKVVVVSGD